MLDALLLVCQCVTCTYFYLLRCHSWLQNMLLEYCTFFTKKYSFRLKATEVSTSKKSWSYGNMLKLSFKLYN